MVKAVHLLLAGSLAANVFLGGFVAGRMLHAPGPPRHEMRPERGEDARHMLRAAAANPEVRAAFEARFKEERMRMRRDAEESRRLRDALAAALSAEPFVRAEADAAAAAVAAFEQRRQQRGGAILIDVFEKLPPETRRRIIEERAQAQQRRGERLKEFRRRREAQDEEPARAPE
jgi:Spy/CpxP family protein refolding chaperone